MQTSHWTTRPGHVQAPSQTPPQGTQKPPPPTTQPHVPVAWASDVGGAGQSDAEPTFASAAEIDAWFRARSDMPYLEWFNATQAGRGAWAPLRNDAGKIERSFKMQTNADTKRRFTVWWDAAPAVIFGQKTITLGQFVALQSIFVNELGGGMAPVSELFQGVKAHPGIGYLFDKIGKKRSYNTAPNKTALECFNDANFIAAHGHLPLARELARTTNSAWGGVAYPSGVITDIAQAGFVAEADFCKFRGRGMIQTTWRSAYRAIVKYIQGYQGTQPKVLEFAKRWASMDPDEVLTVSSNADWDDLFQNTDYVVARAGVRLHAAATSKYLNISILPAIRLGTKPGSLQFMGASISGSAPYGRLFKDRCTQIIDHVMWGPASQPVAAAKSIAGPDEGPPPSSTLSWPGATDEQLRFMRRVYDRHVANAKKIRPFVANVPGAQLGTIEGGHRARTAAAAAMVALLKDARAALASAEAAGDEQAAKIGSLRVSSAYRSVTQQFAGWQGSFPGYYAETRTQRLAAGGGEHGVAAKQLLAGHIGKILGAPGYSLHNDGRAIDLGTLDAKGKAGLGPYKSQRAAWRASWLWTWLTSNAGTYGYVQNVHIDEPWHWEYRGPATPAAAKSLAVSLGSVEAGDALVANVPLLASHHDVGPDLALRWNAMPDRSGGIDVVVHLHGFLNNRHLDLRDNKLPLSGLDFSPPTAPAGVKAPKQPAWAGRTRPTLLVIPRGRARPGHGSAYDFPALVAPGAFAQLITVALRNFEEQAGLRQCSLVRRIILTAHSGGGAALNKILAAGAGTSVDPHEVHVFDALYGPPDGLSAWLRRRLGHDVERLQAGVGDPRLYLATEGGALRVIYTPGDRHSTQPSSKKVEQLIGALAPKGTPGRDALERFYRVQSTAVDHGLVPYWYGGRLLADGAAQIPPPARKAE
jgi:hypothetical protein